MESQGRQFGNSKQCLAWLPVAPILEELLPRHVGSPERRQVDPPKSTATRKTNGFMGLHKIDKGLDLPITGEPQQTIDSGAAPSHAALLAADYVGMKPTMLVSVGDDVRRGQPVFEDKKTPGVIYTAPAGGRVAAINRGERRAFQSLVIELDRSELAGGRDSVAFDAYSGKHPAELSGGAVRNLLVESGLWTAFRTRPFGKVPEIAAKPHSIFVTAIDTNPLAPSVDVALRGREEYFAQGLAAVGKVAEPAVVYVCKAPGSAVGAPAEGNFSEETFSGPHPSGTAGVHIHLLDPVDLNKQVWHVDYQDVIAIGRLFAAGALDVERIVSLAGPAVERPRLLRTRLGASTASLTNRELKNGEARIVSGSVLSGRTAAGDVFGYLGRYHSQISVLAEARGRDFLGWLSPGAGAYSITNVFLSKLMPGKKFDFTTSANGSLRAMTPIGLYEKVMPMDILPAPLLRALLVADEERAQELGALELCEEDVALCSFVSPGKADYGPLLRQVLTKIEKEG